MAVSIPINTLPTLAASRVTGRETIPSVQYEDENAYTYQTAVSSLFYPECIGATQIVNNSITSNKLSIGGPSWNTSGTLSLSGNLEVGNKTSSALTLSLGYNRAVSRDTSILMFSDVGTVADATIVRKSGENGAFDLTNTGTGFLKLVQTGGAPITFTTNSNERVRIASSGDVGIGTVSPSQRLHVVGNAICSGTLSANKGVFQDDEANSVTNGALVLTGGSGAILIDDAAQKRISWNDGGGNFTIRSGNRYNSGEKFVGSGGAAKITFTSDTADGTIEMQVAQKGTDGATVTYDNTVRLAHDRFTVTGNVGINTGDPGTYELNVNGTTKTNDLYVTGGTDLGQYTRSGAGVTTGETNIAIGYDRTGAGISKLLIYGRAGAGASGYVTLQKEANNDGNATLSDTGSGILYIKKDNVNGSIRFQTGGANDRVTILPNGNFGINTVNPGVPLEVNGAVKAVSYNSTSSLRYKENIRPLNGALDIVAKLNSVRFDWKESGSSDIGLIAEEVNEIIPEIVLKNDKGEPDAIDYSRLTSILINAINELQTK